MKTGIYKLEFNNNKYYIGSSLDINRRYKHHCRLLINNKHGNNIMQNHYNKYKELPTIQIIQYTPDINKDELLLIEQKWLNFHIGLENNINIAKNASGGNNILYQIGQKCANPDCNTTYINVTETPFRNKLCERCNNNMRNNGNFLNNKQIYQVGQKCANSDCSTTYINRQKTPFTKELCLKCYQKLNYNKKSTYI